MATVLIVAAVLVARSSAFSPPNYGCISHNVPTQVSSALGAVSDPYDTSYHATTNIENRRTFISAISSSIGIITSSSILLPLQVASADDSTTIPAPVIVAATGDAKKLFNEGRALEAQGNILAAQRLYLKVTKIAPRFIYGWSNLGNTLVAQGQLGEAEESYTKAIDLCQESLKQAEGSSFGTKRCDDLYLILLNRGSVRLNNNMPKEALDDLQKSNTIRGRPDAVILQNLVRETYNAMLTFRQCSLFFIAHNLHLSHISKGTSTRVELLLLPIR